MLQFCLHFFQMWNNKFMFISSSLIRSHTYFESCVNNGSCSCITVSWLTPRTLLTRPCSWWPCLPECSEFWWVQVDLEAVSQPVGVLASFSPFRRSPARPAALSPHADRFYVSSDWCPPPSPPGPRSLRSQAAGKRKRSAFNELQQTHRGGPRWTEDCDIKHCWYLSVTRTTTTTAAEWQWAELKTLPFPFILNSSSDFHVTVIMLHKLYVSQHEFPLKRQKPETLQMPSYTVWI